MWAASGFEARGGVGVDGHRFLPQRQQCPKGGGGGAGQVKVGGMGQGEVAGLLGRGCEWLGCGVEVLGVGTERWVEGVQGEGGRMRTGWQGAGRVDKGEAVDEGRLEWDGYGRCKGSG